jgi:Uma2 family endonuclease
MLPNKQFWTVAEYLDFELTTDERYEYFDGEVRLQKSSNANRGALVSTLIGLLGAQLRNRDECLIYGTTMRIETPSGLFTHPSLSVVWGEGLYRPEEDNATLLNPIVLVEACKFQTELDGIRQKFAHYPFDTEPARISTACP